MFTKAYRLLQAYAYSSLVVGWLLEVCLGEGAKERGEFLTFRDTFLLHLPHFSCEANTATIILQGDTNAVRYLSLNYLFWTFIVQEL